jgi:hypothetical protein
VLANRAVGQHFYCAVQRFAVDTALAREHAPDSDDLSANAEVLSAVRGAATRGLQVCREDAQPYLGDDGHGVRVRFTEQGFVLTTALGDTPVVSLGAPGVFACGGVLTASCFSGVFDTDAHPARLQLDLLFNPGQPFDLVRKNE